MYLRDVNGNKLEDDNCINIVSINKKFCSYKNIFQKLDRAGKLKKKYEIESGQAFVILYQNYKLVKLLCCPQPLKDNFFNAKKHVKNITIFEATISSLPKYILETFGFIILVGIISYYIYMQNSATMAIPIISLYALSFYRLLPSVNKILINYNQIIFRKHSVNDFHEFLSQTREYLKTNKITFTNQIKLQSISFCYEHKKNIFTNLNLSIEKGTRVAFVGNSGLGKSTLADIIMGLNFPQNGKIYVDNIELSYDNVNAWRNKIGYVPQSIFLCAGTVAENIVLGRKYDEKKIIDVLKQAHIYETLLQKEGINSFVGERGVTISGGQKQRIAIARALYGDPEVLIFDEATSSLDYKTEEQIMNEIYNLDITKTIIIVAHRLTTVQRCQKIYHVFNQSTELIQDISVLYKTKNNNTVAEQM